jgi:hypothetical protein
MLIKNLKEIALSVVSMKQNSSASNAADPSVLPAISKSLEYVKNVYQKTQLKNGKENIPIGKKNSELNGSSNPIYSLIFFGYYPFVTPRVSTVALQHTKHT